MPAIVVPQCHQDIEGRRNVVRQDLTELKLLLIGNTSVRQQYAGVQASACD